MPLKHTQYYLVVLFLVNTQFESEIVLVAHTLIKHFPSIRLHIFILMQCHIYIHIYIPSYRIHLVCM